MGVRGNGREALAVLLSVFRRCALRGPLGGVGRIIRCAAQGVPATEPIRIIVEDSSKKKAGRKIEGVACYRNGAGSARQEYRTLWGLNFVWAIMRVPLRCWPGQRGSVPSGLSLYLKEEQARKLGVPYQSRSALARGMVGFVVAQLP